MDAVSQLTTGRHPKPFTNPRGFFMARGDALSLYRITEHGRRMLSVVVNPASAA